MSSGCGAQLGDLRLKEKVDNLLGGFEEIEFLQFNESEALLFISNTSFKLETDFEGQAVSTILNYLKPYTRYNPFLLKVALRAKTFADACAMCQVKAKDFMRRTLPDENDKLDCKSVKDIAKFLHHAEENSLVSKIEYNQGFYTSII